MIKKMRGFNMVELMVVLAIVAIISAIAYPSYQDSVRKANRSDGMQTLLDTAQRLERCYTTYGTYNNASCPLQSGNTVTSANEHYEITVTSDASTYSLVAEPVSELQKTDEDCETFELDNTGLKTATGANSDKCW